ncbi:E3 ubiquitin-protein ligase RSL1-like [Cornus florida]|uniref:E3 ubiquitin-protein ligase RSL1-like n=1 Tax=Cornus florida TaxID=4283 RepID=UPI00289D53D1|nr:E3 ubiquitin-protein ligase RSL1-like [Cornus florida]
MGNMVDRNEIPPGEDEMEAEEEEEEQFTCEICVEQYSTRKFIFKKKKRCHDHGRFCMECIFKYIERKLDDNISRIPCPAPDCEELFDALSCRPIVPHHLFQKWCDVLCRSAIQGLDTCYCPKPDCSALIINECGERTVMKAKCPQCKNHFCFKCKHPWHAGYGCHEVGETTHHSDIQFGKLVDRNKWKKCPGCGYCVERVAGCRQFFGFANVDSNISFSDHKLSSGGAVVVATTGIEGGGDGSNGSRGVVVAMVTGPQPSFPSPTAIIRSQARNRSILPAPSNPITTEFLHNSPSSELQLL